MFRQVWTGIYLFPLLFFSANMYAQENPSWNGEYSYYADYGKNYAGDAMGVNYSLTIDSDSGAHALLIEEGYQTDDTIDCKVRFAPNKVSFFFTDFGNGRITNKYDVLQYKPDQLLFILEYSKNKLITHWEGINPKARDKKGFEKLRVEKNK